MVHTTWKCRNCGAACLVEEGKLPASKCLICGLDTPWFIPGDEKASGGAKFDHGKPRWDLIPFRALASMVDVLTHGAKEYAPNNWRKVEGAHWRYYRAALGHLVAWWLGEKLDQKSGLPHLAHAACCIFFLLELDEERVAELAEQVVKLATRACVTCGEVKFVHAADGWCGECVRCIFKNEDGTRCTNRGVADYDGFTCAEHPLVRK